MIAITIVLAVLLLGASLIAGVCLRHFNSLSHNLQAERKRIDRFVAANEDTEARYVVEFLRDGRLAVVRVSYVMGGFTKSVIKTFEDTDYKFNILCAEELCEHLNEKISHEL